MGKRTNRAQRLRSSAAMLLMLCSVPALAADDDAPVTGTLGGRIHLDFANFNNDQRGTPNGNDVDFRRLWLDVSGRFFAVDYKLEADFAGDKTVARDVYISKDFSAGRLTVGQFKQFYSLDDRTGSNYGSFLERGYLASTLAPTYRQGIAWQGSRDGYTWGATGYRLASIDNWKIEGNAIGGRGTWAPRRQDGDVLHLGISLAHERYGEPGANGTPGLNVRPRPAGYFSDASRITLANFDAGRDTDVDKWTLEYAQVRGPWSWQAELGGGEFDDGAQRARILSGYAFLSWFVTGESRAYDTKTGRFTRIRDIRHERGAFELALRYDEMRGQQHVYGQPDFIDASVQSLTLGGNWYLRPNLRFMLDLIESRNQDRRIGATTDRTHAVTGRFQFDF
jgi:phosphate-selective porin OprO and OprP